MELKSSVQDLNSVTKQFKVVIPAETVAEKVEQSLSDIMRKVKVKGFRPGKVPRHIVESLHGGRVRFDVANELINTTLTGLVKEHDILMVGKPEIDIASFEPGKELEYTASISIYPKPNIKGYESLSAKAPKLVISEENVDSAIERMRADRAKPEPLQSRNIAERSDVVHASIEVLHNGKSLGRPEPVSVGLDEGRLPKEVEEALVGLEVGQTRDISVRVPEESPSKQLRNKTVVYRVSLTGLSEKVLPEVTDEFAASVDPEVPTVPALRMKIRQLLEERALAEARSVAQARLLDLLIAENEFEVPDILVDEEIRNLLSRNLGRQSQKINIDSIDIEPFRKIFLENATKRVKSAIIVDRIGEIENIVASPDEIHKAINEVMLENGLSREQGRELFDNARWKSTIALEIVRGKILDFITDRASIEYTDSQPEQPATVEEGSAASGVVE